MRDDLRYVIELGGVTAGLVVQEDNLYRFFAADRTYASLDRRLFRSPNHAERTCRSVRLESVHFGEIHRPRRPANANQVGECLADTFTIMVGG